MGWFAEIAAQPFPQKTANFIQIAPFHRCQNYCWPVGGPVDSHPVERALKFVASRRFLLGCFFLFLLNAALFKVSDVDVGYHIRTGELLLETRAIPSQNTFSYTHEHHPWLLHQWLPAILIHGIDRLGGYHAIILATVALATAIFGCLTAAGSLRCKSTAWLVFFLTVGVMAARFRFNMRPDLFSGLFFAVLVYHLAKIRAGDKPNPWLIIGLMVLWANSHAGYVYGVILLGLVCTGELVNRWARRPALATEAWKQLMLCSAIGLGLSVLSVWIVNPNGPGVLLLPFQFFTNQYYMSVIAEYARAGPMQYPWFFGLMALGGLAMALRARKLDWSDALPFLAFAYLGFSAVRNILFFVLWAVPVSTAYAEPLGKAFRKRFPGFDLLFRPSTVHLLIAAVLVWLFGARIVTDATYQYGFGLHAGFYPMPLLRVLQSPQIHGNVFNEMQYGGPILWWAGPQRKVFIDGRLEAYEQSFWTETYEPIYFGEPLWEKVFADFHIHAALVHYGYNMPRPEMLAHRLAESRDWALAGWTESALLYLRRIPEHAGIIAEREFIAIQPLAPSVDYITVENAPQVLTELERMHRDGEAFATSWVLLGRAWLVLGDYPRAAAAYEQSLKTFLPAPLAQRDLAFAYVQLGRYKEAKRLLLGLPRDEVNVGLLKQIEAAR
jgi:hypothetical protein